MKSKYSILFILITFLLLNIGCYSTTKESQSGAVMDIPWKLTEYRILPNATWGKLDANKLIFKEAFITENSISFNDQSCKGVDFKRSSVSLSQYLSAKYHVSVEEMKLIEQQATMIVANCNLSGFGSYLQLIDRRIIIFINGVAFFLMPSINY